MIKLCAAACWYWLSSLAGDRPATVSSVATLWKKKKKKSLGLIWGSDRHSLGQVDGLLLESLWR